MRKIRYNIAEKKKIDVVKFGIFGFIAVAAAMVFILLGVGNLWSSDKRVQLEKEKTRQDLEEIDRLTAETTNLKEGVKRKKAEWKKRVAFANLLINGKAYSSIRKLEVLEKELPEGVFFTQLHLNADTPGNIQVSIAADSLHRLIEAYKNFSKFRPVIKDQDEDEGLFRAALLLHLQTKNKKNKK